MPRQESYPNILEKFWGFDISPPYIIIMRRGKTLFIRRKMAELPKDEPEVSSVFFVFKIPIEEMMKKRMSERRKNYEI